MINYDLEKPLYFPERNSSIYRPWCLLSTGGKPVPKMAAVPSLAELARLDEIYAEEFERVYHRRRPKVNLDGMG